jgi:predicted DNA-binding transcriptional regulator AlpA
MNTTVSSFNELPSAVQKILEYMEVLNQKIDNLPSQAQPPEDENRYVDLKEIIKRIFPQWKRQTIYNKCSTGEIPHSRIGSKLLFNIKECREWRDKQLEQGRIKAQSQIEEEAETLFNQRKMKGEL